MEFDEFYERFLESERDYSSRSSPEQEQIARTLYDELNGGPLINGPVDARNIFIAYQFGKREGARRIEEEYRESSRDLDEIL